MRETRQLTTCKRNRFFFALILPFVSRIFSSLSPEVEETLDATHHSRNEDARKHDDEETYTRRQGRANRQVKNDELRIKAMQDGGREGSAPHTSHFRESDLGAVSRLRKFEQI